jgi:acetylornithine deacetylase
MTESEIYIRPQVQDLLYTLISIPSTRGNEGEVNRFLSHRLKDLVDECELIRIDDSIITDPDYSFALEGHSYKSTPNLRCEILGTGGGKSVVFNTHVDVVPPSAGQLDPFNPRMENGIVYGRGACDAKGQIAALFGLILLRRRENIHLKGNLIFDFVFEEECGGNGTLAMIRRGIEADAAVVLEPSELAIIPSVRGAVWFEVTVYGRAGHSGRSQDTVSALKKAYEAMRIMEEYHDRVLAESRGDPLFDQFANPMPITFGQLDAGDWPATTPSRAVFKGVFGFLPNKNRFQIQEGLRNSLKTNGDHWLKEHHEIRFPMLNSDGNVTPQNHPLVTTMQDAVRSHGYDGKITAMTASCDAWLYNNQLKIPTIVFGPGSLKYAHSNEEQIVFQEIMDASEILCDFVRKYCA